VGLAAAGESPADVNPNWIWKDGKRTLKVFVNTGDPAVDAVVMQSINAWNTAATGWTLDPTGTATSNDVAYVSGTLGRMGGGRASADGREQAGITHVTLTYDPHPVEGFTWGNGITQLTKSQAGTVMHELGHNLGLGHGGGLRSTSRNIYDPGDAVTGDGNATTPSTADISFARQTANPPDAGAPPPAQAAAVLGPTSADTQLNVGGTIVDFPAGVYVTSSTTVTLTTDAPELLANNTSAVGSGLALMKGLDITSSGLTAQPQVSAAAPSINVTVPYTNSPSVRLDVNDPDYGPFVESSLTPFYYDLASNRWLALAGSATVNTSAHTITFSFSPTLLLSSTKFTPTSAQDPFTTVLQIAIAGAQQPLAQPPSVPALPLSWSVLLTAGVLGAGVGEILRRRRATLRESAA
jgi:hypothetical protein